MIYASFASTVLRARGFRPRRFTVVVNGVNAAIINAKFPPITMYIDLEISTRAISRRATPRPKRAASLRATLVSSRKARLISLT